MEEKYKVKRERGSDILNRDRLIKRKKDGERERKRGREKERERGTEKERERGIERLIE